MEVDQPSTALIISSCRTEALLDFFALYQPAYIVLLRLCACTPSSARRPLRAQSIHHHPSSVRFPVPYENHTKHLTSHLQEALVTGKARLDSITVIPRAELSVTESGRSLRQSSFASNQALQSSSLTNTLRRVCLPSRVLLKIETCVSRTGCEHNRKNGNNGIKPVSINASFAIGLSQSAFLLCSYHTCPDHQSTFHKPTKHSLKQPTPSFRVSSIFSRYASYARLGRTGQRSQARFRRYQRGQAALVPA